MIVPFDNIVKEDYHLDFSLPHAKDDLDRQNDKLLSSGAIDFMVESKLQSLYESAHENGKDKILVKLETKPNKADILNLFCFPFLSRKRLKADPSLLHRYRRMLGYMVTSPNEARPLFRQMVAEFQESGLTESTVISQVLLLCDECFAVKDVATGAVIQGHEDGKFRQVYHLVRMEMVVETRPNARGLSRFSSTPGNWQITDIDDLLEGNLLL